MTNHTIAVPIPMIAYDDSPTDNAVIAAATCTTAEFLDKLYADSASYIEPDRYGSIGEAYEFFTKVVGVTFDGRQDIVGGMTVGAAVDLRREPLNAFDSNAIGVWYGALHIGFLRKEIARRLAPNMDEGARYHATIGSVTGGGLRSFGLNIHVTRDRPKRDQTIRSGASHYSRDEILSALLGAHSLRDSQHDVLARVEAGQSVVAILGTGRGKSLCFQYPAAVNALERHEKTLVLYPLRALANDQYESLVRKLEPLGLRVLRANGSISSDERSELFEALETGAWDILCATPEFFTHHLYRFTSASQPQMVVIDEAHHVHTSGHRPAYGRIADAVETLGSPQVLALTATAGDDAFKSITTAFRINSWVIDPTIRTNLQMIDARGVTNKLAYILNVLTTSDKAIVYCNSRTEATKLAEKLRARLTGGAVAFYHAGVPTPERTAVEQLFRNNEVQVVVATSAFGEGIDLPDIRHVFLYHLNFNFTEFNQQSGRAGRDSDPAQIHLMFGEKDRRINDFIIERSAPTIYTLRSIYRELSKIAPTDGIRDTYVGLAGLLDMDKVDAGTIGTAMRIFHDEGLIHLGEDDDGRFIRFIAAPPKVDLTKNERFAEGEAERELFDQFCEVILTADAHVLENLINRPIYPSNVVHLK